MQLTILSTAVLATAVVAAPFGISNQDSQEVKTLENHEIHEKRDYELSLDAEVLEGRFLWCSESLTDCVRAVKLREPNFWGTYSKRRNAQEYRPLYGGRDVNEIWEEQIFGLLEATTGIYESGVNPTTIEYSLGEGKGGITEALEEKWAQLSGMTSTQYKTSSKYKKCQDALYETLEMLKVLIERQGGLVYQGNYMKPDPQDEGINMHLAELDREERGRSEKKLAQFREQPEKFEEWPIQLEGESDQYEEESPEMEELF